MEEEKVFLEFRRKAKKSELLSASTEKLLRELRFSGRISLVVKNGTVMKSGYEEGMFDSTGAGRGRGGEAGEG